VTNGKFVGLRLRVVPVMHLHLCRTLII